MKTITALFRVAGPLARRVVAASILGVGLLAAPALAQNAVPGAAQQIANQFSSVKTLTGDFVQFGPRGEQTEGTFYIERPGKIRFNYNKPSPISCHFGWQIRCDQ